MNTTLLIITVLSLGFWNWYGVRAYRRYAGSRPVEAWTHKALALALPLSESLVVIFVLGADPLTALGAEGQTPALSVFLLFTMLYVTGHYVYRSEAVLSAVAGWVLPQKAAEALRHAHREIST